MRRLLTTSLMLLGSAALPHSASAQSVFASEPSLAGTRELGIFVSGRVLSDAYSSETGKAAFGGAVTFATHLTSVFAVQGGLAANYSRQEYSYYKPPLLTFTPTVSLIVQRPTAASVQPYALLGAGYEFIRFTHPRCDCDQNQSLGVANLGVGIRKMISGRRAFRFEVSSQIGSGGPAFTALAGVSVFLGTRDVFAKQRTMKRPDRLKKEPPVTPRPVQRTTIQPATVPPAPAPAPVNPAPSNSVTRAPSTSPLPTGVGAVLLQVDGTQADFSKPTWRDDVEPLLDGLVVDLISDAGQNIKLSIEAHTDNVGSRAGNTALGLDRAKAVREFLINQGINADRITVSSAGGDNPIGPNTTALGRQKNRRIVIRRTN